MKNDSTISVSFGRFRRVPGRFLVHGVEGQEIPDNILKILCNLSRNYNVWYINTKYNILYDCHINSCGEFAIEVYLRNDKIERPGPVSVFTVIIPKQ